jgi:hypothetical protein
VVAARAGAAHVYMVHFFSWGLRGPSRVQREALVYYGCGRHGAPYSIARRMPPKGSKNNLGPCVYCKKAGAENYIVVTGQADVRYLQAHHGGSGAP